MFEKLILLGLGVVAICTVIIMVSAIVWVWERLEERELHKTRCHIVHRKSKKEAA